MTVNNVLKGLLTKYTLEEINILTGEKCVFSGTVEQWRTTDAAMTDYKRKIAQSPVKNRLMFNNRKVFLFI